MSLLLATLLTGVFLLVFGIVLLLDNSAVQSTLKALPRSQSGAAIFFGGAAVWFVYLVWNLSTADLVLFSKPEPWALLFAALAGSAFFYVPDFLAVRGLCILTLLAGWRLLMAAYMEYDKPQRLCLVSFVYLAASLAIYLGAVPYKLRDFFHWLFATRGRPRVLGGALAAYGLVLTTIAFTY
ncbi:MAG: hypothetical protein QM790_15960 [Nibricoccus sp.]